MEEHRAFGKIHSVYGIDETPSDILWKDDWKTAKKGDWVLSDDDSVIQVLDVKKMGKTLCIQTCTGLYSIDGTMDTNKRKDIHTLGGNSWYDRVVNREKPTNNEILFAARVAKGEGPTEAYLAIYDTKNQDRAKKMAKILVKTERVQKLMKKDLKDVFSKLGISTETMVEVVWDVAMNGKNDSDRLKAASMIWEAGNLVEKQKITEIKGVFQGYKPEELDAFERPKEIASGVEE
tara:strand:- start:21414 stop:22115 length:702 start_codon:yes stop_codon:yes gene_type:complete